MQNFQQSRVYEQGLRISHQLGEYLPPQGLQEAPELSHPPVQRGRVESRYPRKQMRKESLCVAQEGALRFHASQLLEEGESDDLRIRKPLYGLVASSAVGIEQGIGVVYEAEEHGQSFFQVGKRGGMLGLGHERFLSSRVRMAPFVPLIHATNI